MSPAIRVRRQQSKLLTVAQVAVDLFSIGIGFWVAAYLRFGTGLFGRAEAPAADYPLIIAVSVPVWLTVFGLSGMYDSLGMRGASEEVRRVFRSVNLGLVMLVLTSFVLAERDLSRAFVAGAWFSCLISVTSGRLAFRKVLKLIRKYGKLRVPMLVVGLNEEARAIARTLVRCPWIGYTPVGFVAANGELNGRNITKIDGLPIYGTAAHIAGAVDAAGASAVLVASSAVPEEKLALLYRDLQDHEVEVRVSAGLLNIAASRVAVEPLDGIPVLALRKIQLARSQRVVKRAFDLVGAALLLIGMAPLFLLVSLIVKLTSPGPVFYRQIRIGQYGREFKMVKFRSMVAGADRMLIDLRNYNEAEGLLFKMRDDPRVTKIGKFIRRWSVDELPQLFNVITGRMSLVGPRPPLPEEVARYDDWIRGRVQVKPGMTGLWQVNGRHELSFQDYVRYDLFYVENWSIAFDLHILWRTLPAVLGRAGSY